jgi:hypothetical protein
MAAATKAYRAAHKIDPKMEMWNSLKGWLEDIEPTGADYLVCVYERPEGMAGTTLLMPSTASRLVEDKFQGFVGMIVKSGPNVAAHDAFFRDGKMPGLGDWVGFRVMDTTPFTLGERAMRIVPANMIRLILKTPDCVV